MISVRSHIGRRQLTVLQRVADGKDPAGLWSGWRWCCRARCWSATGTPRSDAFCASRLSGDWGYAYGTLPSGLDLGPIIERATPKIA